MVDVGAVCTVLGMLIGWVFMQQFELPKKSIFSTFLSGGGYYNTAEDNVKTWTLDHAEISNSMRRKVFFEDLPSLEVMAFQAMANKTCPVTQLGYRRRSCLDSNPNRKKNVTFLELEEFKNFEFPKDDCTVLFYYGDPSWSEHSLNLLPKMVFAAESLPFTSFIFIHVSKRIYLRQSSLSSDSPLLKYREIPFYVYQIILFENEKMSSFSG